jgi:hypothetical protein
MTRNRQHVVAIAGHPASQRMTAALASCGAVRLGGTVTGRPAAGIAGRLAAGIALRLAAGIALRLAAPFLA